MTNKELGNYIESHVSLLLADIETFIWLKLDKKDDYDSASNKYGIGGGNFLSVIGLFSILDFLSQIYTIARLGKIPKKKKNVIVPESNQTERVWKLLYDSTSCWGISEVQFQKCWRSYRNPLVHNSFPKSPIFAVKFQDVNSYETFIGLDSSKLKQNSPFGFDDNGTPICFVELLYLSTYQITLWVSDEIRKDTFSQLQVANIEKWFSKTFKK